MNKKWLLGIILVLTCLAITIILVLNSNTRYNKLVVNEKKWNSIISNRTESTSIKIDNIKFNDYNLIIDENNSVIYYSVVNSSKKFNPSIKYKTNNKASIAINDKISDEKLEQTDSLKIMIYNEKEYRIYTLVATNYPTLNVVYKNNNDINRKVPIELELFDNHIDSPQRFIKSDGKFRIIEEDNLYSFSLFKQSPGDNKRENHISIFGMEQRDEYLLKKVNKTEEQGRYIKLFINNKYIGLYSLDPKEGGIDPFERNRENNK